MVKQKDLFANEIYAS